MYYFISFIPIYIFDMESNCNDAENGKLETFL